MTVTVGRVALLAAAFALVTIAAGWWTVAAVAVFWGFLAGNSVRYPGLQAGVAAGIGWLALIVGGAPLRETARLAASVGQLLSVPGPALVVVTLGLGSMLGLLGSWLGSSIRVPHVAAR